MMLFVLQQNSKTLLEKLHLKYLDCFIQQTHGPLDIKKNKDMTHDNT